jgi:hypothetical protein
VCAGTGNNLRIRMSHKQKVVTKKREKGRATIPFSLH